MCGVTIVETVIVFAGIPLGALLLLGVSTMAGRAHRAARYKPGQAWEHPPVWWTANLAGLPSPQPAPDRAPAGQDLVGGGARGTW